MRRPRYWLKKMLTRAGTDSSASGQRHPTTQPLGKPRHTQPPPAPEWPQSPAYEVEASVPPTSGVTLGAVRNT